MVEATYERKEKELKRKANLPGKLFQLRSHRLVDLSLTAPQVRTGTTLLGRRSGNNQCTSGAHFSSSG